MLVGSLLCFLTEVQTTRQQSHRSEWKAADHILLPERPLFFWPPISHPSYYSYLIMCVLASSGELPVKPAVIGLNNFSSACDPPWLYQLSLTEAGQPEGASPMSYFALLSGFKQQIVTTHGLLLAISQLILFFLLSLLSTVQHDHSDRKSVTIMPENSLQIVG